LRLLSGLSCCTYEYLKADSRAHRQHVSTGVGTDQSASGLTMRESGLPMSQKSVAQEGFL